MILLTSFAIVVLINISFYLFLGKFSFSKSSSASSLTDYPVSVIVCARNESEHLNRCIPSILSQDYPDFELILVNDHSNDDSLEVMERFALKDPRIIIVDVAPNEAFWGSKKYALTLGIKRARNKRLLFTDADCIPASDQWIREMTGPLSNEKQIVIGYGGYERIPTLLNKFIRFETVLTAAQYLSLAMRGIPYMAVGRNLSYTSNLFFENKGFISHMDLRSGDDDLFVNEVANRNNVAVQTSAEAFTISSPKTTWRSWIQQKRRHYTTATRYKFGHKVLLSGFYLSNLLFWVLLPVAWYPDNWIPWAVLIMIRIALEMFILGKAAVKLGERDLVPLLPFFELFLVLIQLSIFSFGSRSKQYRWK